MSTSRPADETFTVTLSTCPSPAEIAQISAGLTRFNRSRIPDKGYLPIAAMLHDADGELSGGVSAYLAYGWLFIDTLWIDERARNHGQGRRLMLAAEAEACSHGCRRAWLDTFSFQAKEFYEKLGYAVFGQLEDFPPGHRRYFMRKNL